LLGHNHDSRPHQLLLVVTLLPRGDSVHRSPYWKRSVMAISVSTFWPGTSASS
jgi:hypothetical protein